MPYHSLYAFKRPAARLARRRDDEWFRKNPSAIWRVRLLLDGESPFADSASATSRAYGIVIDHKRNRDTRRKSGRLVYPHLIPWSRNGEEVRRTLEAEAARRAAAFKLSSQGGKPLSVWPAAS